MATTHNTGQPMVEVGSYPTRSDAELAQSRLRAEAIDSVVVADDAGGAYPFDLTGGAHLLVADPDVEDAAAVLSDQRHATRKEQR